MLWAKSKRITIPEKIGATLFLGGWSYLLLTPGLLCDTGSSVASYMSVFMLAISKVPQLIMFVRELGTGSLSYLSTLLQILLSMARLSSLILESDNTGFQVAYGLSLLINIWILTYISQESD